MAQKRTQNTNNTPLQPNEFGKLPPQAIELEEAVLGALMLEKNAFSDIGELLKPESFYKEAHQKIFAVIRDLNSQDDPVDMLTVTEGLKRRKQIDEVGGPFYITQLTSKVASAAHIEYHARIIAQKYLQRELIKLSSEIQNKAYDDQYDVADLMNEAEAGIFELSQKQAKKDVTQINPVIEEALQEIQEAAKKTSGVSGIPSGFTRVDKITSGWQRSDLIILAARPAMGKTAFVLSMARNMALEHNQAVAIFSLEMANVQLVKRFIVSETELPAEKIKNGQLEDWEWEQLDAKIKNLIDAPIYIDDSPGLSVFELRSKCRMLKKRHNIQIIIIDYLQLMNASGMNPGSREQEVSLISRSLKGLAKELNVPIIALSQLNRGVEGRAGLEGKRPQLSDLRESGAIEQDADMVCFIHRPEYYKITEDAEGNSLVGIAELVIAKHRNGATADVRMRFRKELARFQNLEEDQYGGFDASPESPVKTFGSKINEGDAFPQNNDPFGTFNVDNSTPF